LRSQYQKLILIVIIKITGDRTIYKIINNN
jgi:hypothetical protein